MPQGEQILTIPVSIDEIRALDGFVQRTTEMKEMASRYKEGKIARQAAALQSLSIKLKTAGRNFFKL